MTINRAARARELASSDRERPVEVYFRDRVRRDLGGLVVKLAPLTAGVPDRLVLLPGGRVELVELKADDGDVRLVQRAFAASARARGVRIHLVTGRAGVDAWIRNRTEEMWEDDNIGEVGLSTRTDVERPVAFLDVEDLRSLIRWVMAPRKDEPAVSRAITAAATAVPLPRPVRPDPCPDGEHPDEAEVGERCLRCGRTVAPPPDPSRCDRCGAPLELDELDDDDSQED